MKSFETIVGPLSRAGFNRARVVELLKKNVDTTIARAMISEGWTESRAMKIIAEAKTELGMIAAPQKEVIEPTAALEPNHNFFRGASENALTTGGFLNQKMREAIEEKVTLESKLREEIEENSGQHIEEVFTPYSDAPTKLEIPTESGPISGFLEEPRYSEKPEDWKKYAREVYEREGSVNRACEAIGISAKTWYKRMKK